MVTAVGWVLFSWFGIPKENPFNSQGLFFVSSRRLNFPRCLLAKKRVQFNFYGARVKSCFICFFCDGHGVKSGTAETGE